VQVEGVMSGDEFPRSLAGSLAVLHQRGHGAEQLVTHRLAILWLAQVYRQSTMMQLGALAMAHPCTATL
jgi:hypothetical protein